MKKKTSPGRSADATGRSKRDAKHVRHYEYMLASPAYRSLSCYAKCLLVEFYRLYDGDNNGELFMSMREAARRIGTSVNPAQSALAELQAKGFTRARQNGAFSYKARHATKWILTEFNFQGDSATKDFMRWHPPATLAKPVYGGRNWQPKNKTRYHGKSQTVSREESDALRKPESDSSRDTDSAVLAASTVSREETQISYQGDSAGDAAADKRDVPLGSAAAAPAAQPPRLPWRGPVVVELPEVRGR